MNKKEQAIAWIKEEIRSLERAPELNGCPMTPEWAEQLEIMRTCLEAVRDHFPDSTKMMPLTLEQLREMDGKPAYWMEDDSCGIISVDSAGPWAGIPFFRGRKFEVNFEYDIESRGMDVYAYQPAHIDREAWTAEWEEDGECDHKPYRVRSAEKWKKYKCSKCGYKAGRRTSQKYCPSCGKAMTPEAWDELEKRLRG